MKKLLVFSVIALIGLTASAADQTKEQFIAAAKAKAEAAGKEFNAAGAEKQFAAKDTNKDGKLSAEELAAKSAPKAKKAE
jgi:hypothetical protein